MDTPTRFRDNAETLWTFMDRLLVRCPVCGALAEARRRGERSDWMASVACVHCGFARSEAFDEMQWYGPVSTYIEQGCRRCGRWLNKRDERDRIPHNRSTSLRCSGCGQTTDVPRLWSQVIIGHGKAIDPIFGLSLWLQIPCCNTILWAYNAAHLQFLKAFVGASLRERKPNLNGSLASRLPTWIKQAKHR
jgi:transcription elongation factor Elf1